MTWQQFITTWEVLIKLYSIIRRENTTERHRGSEKEGFWEELPRGTSNYCTDLKGDDDNHVMKRNQIKIILCILF